MDQFAIMSPFRTQATLIKDTIEKDWDGPKSDCLERNIGSIEEFLSVTFDTILVSFCKTKNCEEEGGWPLNSKQITDFILSRSDKLVIFGKKESLTAEWK